MSKSAGLEQLKDTLAKSAFGMTKGEASSQGIYVCCKQPALPKCYSEEGRREYGISGLCEECFDKICGEG